MDAYSQLKPAWHPATLADLRDRGVANPVHVNLVLSDLCNQDCSFCAYRISGGLSTELFADGDNHNPNRKMPTEIALQFLRDFAAGGGRAVQFTGGGEPTVHRDFYRILETALDLGLECGLVTNGVRLEPDQPAVSGLKWVRVSVDAGTADTYSKVRRVPRLHWDRAWETIRGLGDLQARLGVGFVVTLDNYREIADCVRLVAETRADYLRVGAVFTDAGVRFYGDKIPEILGYLAEAREVAALESVQLVDLFGRRMNDLHGGAPEDSWCGYQYFTTYVGADLGVYRCCNTSYTRAGKVWDLGKATFAAYLAQLKPDGFDARGCRFCQFRGQNAAISALVNEPQDVNFV